MVTLVRHPRTSARTALCVSVCALLLLAAVAGAFGLPKAARAQEPPTIELPPTLEIPVPPAVFGDIFKDDNGDGVYDWPVESGIRGVGLALSGPIQAAAQDVATAVYETVTDDNGFYYFTNLPAVGAYLLAVDMPPGYNPLETQTYLVQVEDSAPAKVQIEATVSDMLLPILLGP